MGITDKRALSDSNTFFNINYIDERRHMEISPGLAPKKLVLAFL